MNKRVEKLIKDLYTQIYNKVYAGKNITSLMKDNKHVIRSEILNLQKSESYDKFAKTLAKKLAASAINTQKGQWRKYYKEARKRHIVGIPDTYRKFELQIMQKAIEHNMKMIKSVPQYVLEIQKHKYVSTLIAEVAQGKLSRGSFEKQLRKHGIKRAKVIARTETAKLQTAITEYRAKDLGSVAYLWRSSNDKRTRPSHREMNDVVVFWRKDSEKPLRDNMRGNAGEYPNCRCDAHPILDENDLTKSYYKVYNYKNDKIETYSRRKVIEMIENGGIS